jgi:Coenzyme PQQ synthesis protein D (PqqD)
MKQNSGSRPPLARKEGLIVRELPDEVLVYDRDRDKAHCLNQTAALVWKYCDGKTTVSGMTRRLEQDLNAKAVDENIVWFALSQLSKDHLLEDDVVPPSLMAGLSRRQMVRTLGLAAVIAVPLVTSIVAPTPAQASSLGGTGAPCSSPAQCSGPGCSAPGNLCGQPSAGLCC